MTNHDLLIVAGEASGDLHGARLLSALRELVPGLSAYGMGGDELAAAGFEPLAHSREIAAEPRQVAHETERLLSDPQRISAMRSSYRALRERLGNGGFGAGP